MNIEVKGVLPSNYGYLRSSIPEDLLLSLREEREGAETNNDKVISDLGMSYGNTTDHYALSVKNSKCLSNFISTYLVHEFDRIFNYIESLKFLDNNLPFVFSSAWINVQESNRYIPVHSHRGVYSYTCWINLPKESLFEFLYPTIIGNPMTQKINLTKEDEGGILFFPALLQHCVHPFKDNSKRISISGNILLGTQ